MSRHDVTGSILNTIKEEMYAQKKVVEGTRVAETNIVLMTRETAVLQMKVAEMLGASIEHGAAVEADMAAALGLQLRETTNKMSESVAEFDASLTKHIDDFSAASEATAQSIRRWTMILGIATIGLVFATGVLAWVEWRKEPAPTAAAAPRRVETALEPIKR
jgi:hypothetical protein